MEMASIKVAPTALIFCVVLVLGFLGAAVLTKAQTAPANTNVGANSQNLKFAPDETPWGLFFPSQVASTGPPS
jgi:hypothetical protein